MERRYRREFNMHIGQLRAIVPYCDEFGNTQPNKVNILKKTVDYIRDLQQRGGAAVAAAASGQQQKQQQHGVKYESAQGPSSPENAEEINSLLHKQSNDLSEQLAAQKQASFTCF